MLRILIVLMAGAALTGCKTARDTLPGGPQAYATIPAAAADRPPNDYRVGPLDVLAVTVFREPDLTFKELQVDASGNLLFPLIGAVRAAGKTANELSVEIAHRLDQRYLRDPQVSVVIASSVSQRVTVEGSVTEPGVYEISGASTLLEALARAKSPTRTAALSQVVVFRNVNGQRMGAVFDVGRIRRGEAPDPAILALLWQVEGTGWNHRRFRCQYGLTGMTCDGGGRELAERPGAMAGAVFGGAVASSKAQDMPAVHCRVDRPRGPQERAADGGSGW